MNSLAALLVEQLDGARDWTLKLLADVSGDDWTFAPAPGLAHITWTCGHLAVAQDLLIHTRCLGKSVLSPDFARHFPMGGPIASAAEYEYPPIEEILATMAEVHRATLAAVSATSEALLAEPCGGKDGAAHPHYTTKRGAVSHAARHEAFHTGQIAMIRRLRGKAFLR